MIQSSLTCTHSLQTWQSIQISNSGELRFVCVTLGEFSELYIDPSRIRSSRSFSGRSCLCLCLCLCLFFFFFFFALCALESVTEDMSDVDDEGGNSPANDKGTLDSVFKRKKKPHHNKLSIYTCTSQNMKKLTNHSKLLFSFVGLSLSHLFMLYMYINM